ncbi:hypothetical protein GGI25_005126 [Coemansia spiralis]|uniref:Uncharacterized protein n=2 Tax=Coemansia TaxID=4863 RepID=A0A9W8G4T0_9FUNG|nr:hypothetical protein EDC05_005537 [Coemansia umbellata]KAJ2619990.1 hypothetical protein GGI26_005388 [Coemansia sp. RSA 1358]KAJ2672417.1 hypothetical protein GGI25_005126 [Coemansia spiralis]
MKFTIAFGVLGAMAQVGLARKCMPLSNSSSSIPEPSYSAIPVPSVSNESTSQYYSSEPAPTFTFQSSAGPYSTSPMPSEYSVTTPGPYSTSPMPSEYSVTTPGPYSTSPMPSEYSTGAASSAEEAETTPTSSAPASMPTSPVGGSAYQITLAQLNQAIPDRQSDDSCSSAQYPSECATNSRAVTAINSALTKYGITKRGEAVAVIALMAFESDNWLYNINHSPGRPGQGTRNMQMYNYNEEYAQLLHPSEASQALASGSNAENSVLALVLDDNDSFGSGFWYLVNKASAYHNSGKLADGSASDFQDYVVNGIGASWTSDRLTTWQSVNAALA